MLEWWRNFATYKAPQSSHLVRPLLLPSSLQMTKSTKKKVNLLARVVSRVTAPLEPFKRYPSCAQPLPAALSNPSLISGAQFLINSQIAIRCRKRDTTVYSAIPLQGHPSSGHCSNTLPPSLPPSLPLYSIPSHRNLNLHGHKGRHSCATRIASPHAGVWGRALSPSPSSPELSWHLLPVLPAHKRQPA